MTPRHARLYAHVFMAFWPWLWWQLYRVEQWQRETGRDLIVTVNRMGRLTVRWMADAPAPDGTYAYAAPLVPAWLRPAVGSDLPIDLAGDGVPVPEAIAPLFETCLCRLVAPAPDTS